MYLCVFSFPSFERFTMMNEFILHSPQLQLQTILTYVHEKNKLVCFEDVTVGTVSFSSGKLYGWSVLRGDY